MQVYTMFSGIGAPEQAQREYGLAYQFVGACEIDKYARSIYRYQYEPKGDIDHDATKLVSGRMPDFNLLIFGWPCQDNSIAGQRAGQKEGTRSGLLSVAAEILRHKKPDYFIAENVPGLYSVKRGLDFIDSLGLLSDVGYDIQWQSLDTRWMLPQSRERVYLVGHLRGGRRPQVFPIGENDFRASERSTNPAVVRAITAGGHSGGHHNGMTLIQKGRGKNRGGKKEICPTLSSSGFERNHAIVPKISPCIRANHHNTADVHFIPADRGGLVNAEETKGNPQGMRIYSPDGLAVSLSSQGGGLGAKTGLYKVEGSRACLTPARMEKRQNGRRLKDENEPMLTLTKQDIHGVAHQGGIRRLTPVECERLQGFPDNHTAKGIDDAGSEIEISDSQRYKAIGNAMSVPIVGMVMSRLQKSFST